jgi:hypothetical protein
MKLNRLLSCACSDEKIGWTEVLLLAVVLLVLFAGFQVHAAEEEGDPTVRNARALVKEGRDIFRYDTFGDQRLWGETLRLHEAIAGAPNGGIGPGVSPRTALAVGLKVDVERLPGPVLAALKRGDVDLDSPATTLALLKLNAVVGVTGFFDQQDRLTSLGTQCALCHSTVDDSFAPGIGRRLDGWANRDLNVGAIINLSPDLSTIAEAVDVDQSVVRQVLMSWGPGKFDASLLLDGRALRPDGRTGAVLIPPAFGLGGVNLHTWTGWGSISYWNALVANLEMGGVGRFFDPRLADEERFPVAAKLGSHNVSNEEDLVTPKLHALQMYQLAIPVPKGEIRPFNFSARRGKQIFNEKAQCAQCHVPPTFTEPGHNLHTPEEICIDSFQAERSPTGAYRTAPLGGLTTHSKGGFYHDGRFPTLGAVVDHYDACLDLGLSGSDKFDLVEYLKTL